MLGKGTLAIIIASVSVVSIGAGAIAVKVADNAIAKNQIEQKAPLDAQSSIVTDQNTPAAAPEATQAPAKAEQPAATQKPVAQPEQAQKPASDGSSYIGKDKAKSIALQRAGIPSDGVTFTKVKLDRDNGIMLYEVEFKKGNVEYEAEIRATDGKLLYWDVDYDDDWDDRYDDLDDKYDD